MAFRGSINPRHFQVEALESARAAIGADRFASVVIDDFLTPSLLAGLLACFENDGNFTEHRSLKEPVGEDGSQADDQELTVERTVSEEAFAAASPTSRLARELLLRADTERDTDSAGWQAHIRFLEMLASPVFKSYLGAVTDTTELRDATYMARTMRHGDLCSAHSDAGDGRTLCMLLYVGDGWHSGFGGRFQNVERGRVARSTEPLGNRLILHRPAPNQIHQVEPISDAGRDWRRHSYSVWFGAFPDEV
jgi:Rps23 Pro-64 3,4-dihydroxylase Tpa1-like proline 4-hydroxylase